MSDQQPDPKTPASPPEAGKLAPKTMTIFDQIFIWTMVLLVGVIFGVGPSIGLVLQGGQESSAYQVSASEVLRRQRIAQLLEEMLNPGGRGRPLFILGSEEEYARNIRLAQLAGDQGLGPSPAEVEALVDDFLARKDSSGKRTYGQMIADSHRAKDLTTGDLALWLSEEAAVAALEARSSSAPALPSSLATVFKPLREDKVTVDQVTLSATPLLPEVKPDDPELASTYENLAELGRFVQPAALVVQIATPDFAALLAAQPQPSEDQLKAWYESHKADYAKPMPPLPAPNPGQTTPPTPPATEYQPFDEVKAAISERLRREAALAVSLAKVEAFMATVEEQALEQGDAATFARAATAAGLQVKEGVEVPDTAGGQVVLPEYGPLTRSAREIGLVANKVGTITDQQKTSDGRWLVLRLAAYKPASRKPSDDPTVRAAVIAELAARRAYPLLLAEAEALRAQAEKAGPGGLRALFADPALKAKWKVEVTTAELSPLEELAAPEPADQSAARPDPRLAASLAVAGNPVSLAAGGQEAVRLLQATGYVASSAPTAEERGQLTAQVRSFLVRRLAMEAAVGHKL